MIVFITAIIHSVNAEPGDAACGSLCRGLDWPAAGPPSVRAFCQADCSRSLEPPLLHEVPRKAVTMTYDVLPKWLTQILTKVVEHAIETTRSCSNEMQAREVWCLTGCKTGHVTIVKVRRLGVLMYSWKQRTHSPLVFLLLYVPLKIKVGKFNSTVNAVLLLYFQWNW
jgi:hypothetical protein